MTLSASKAYGDTTGLRVLALSPGATDTEYFDVAGRVLLTRRRSTVLIGSMMGRAAARA